jgi:hypothetical protein
MRGALQRVFFPLALAIALGPLAAAGCGTSANGVGVCKQIEQARCDRAYNHCQGNDASDINLSPPYYTSGNSEQACIRYYDTACLNGLEVSNASFTQADVNSCLAAINGGSCALVETPWDDPRCAWLVPPAQVEAGTDGDAEAGDADADAGEAAEDAD